VQASYSQPDGGFFSGNVYYLHHVADYILKSGSAYIFTLQLTLIRAAGGVYDFRNFEEV
jgi:hypothetical protein